MTCQYGLAAIDAVNLMKNGIVENPRIAWEEALSKYCERGSFAWEKGCPRGTFLGLCEEGYIKGIPKGKYTNSKKNKAYGIEAVKALKKNPLFINDSIKLWQQIPNRTAQNQNGQLDVVIALWNEDMINKG